VGTVLPAFQKRFVHQKLICRISEGRDGPLLVFSKALGATLRNLLSNRSKGFDIAGFEKLSANSTAFGA
jgi:hypothetical protein